MLSPNLSALNKLRQEWDSASATLLPLAENFFEAFKPSQRFVRESLVDSSLLAVSLRTLRAGVGTRTCST
jgi:hypothetical protein